MSLDAEALDLLFRAARTHRAWTGEPVTDETLRAVYDLLKWGPTSTNCCPARIVFVTSPGGKERLKPALDAGNVAQTMAAPVTAIVAYDLEFYEQLPFLVPHLDARSGFLGKPELIVTTRFAAAGRCRAAISCIAARALGLDCGAMSGFDNAKVDAEFFPDGNVEDRTSCATWATAMPAKLRRAIRAAFEEAC